MTSLIRSVSLKNFKGFSEPVNIDIKPITLLFGANSAGKSSVFQGLQYVREILERKNANADRTLQGGDAVDLGGFLNLVNDRDHSKKIEIAVTMDLSGESFPELVPDAFEDWQTSDDEVFSFYDSLQRVRSKVENVIVKLIVGWSQLRGMPIVVGYEISINDVWCIKIETPLGSRDAAMYINRQNPIFVKDGNDEDQELSDELLKDLGGWIEENDLDNEEIVPIVKKPKISILPELLMKVRNAGMSSPGYGLRSWLSDFDGALPRLDRMLIIPTSGISGASNIYIAREFTAFLSWITIGPAMLLRDQLRSVRYIGPLRRIPHRGFDVSLTKSEAAWSDGMAAWETLLTGPQSLVDGCSEWMSASTKLNTGYSLRRYKTQEMDLSGVVPKEVGSPRPRIRLIDIAGLTHQPQDVGVGISQVLPVVVAAQDSSASVVCLEQPELHIHPSVQVGLGDLLIDGFQQKGLSFMIETHSEHLIMRLQRRIREGALKETPEGQTPLVATDVNVIYLDKDSDGVTVANIIRLDDDGKFLDRWPSGFFPERLRETLPKEIRDKLVAKNERKQ